MKKIEHENDEDRILVSRGRPYMLQKTLADYFGLSLATVQARLKEIDFPNARRSGTSKDDKG